MQSFATMLQNRTMLCKFVLLMKEFILNKADLLGIGVGLACAIHCALMPLILTSGVFAGSVFFNHWFVDIAFLAASLYFAFHSLLKSYGPIHKNPMPLILAFIGFVFISYVVFSHNHSQVLWSVAGGVLLATAHVFNLRLRIKKA